MQGFGVRAETVRELYENLSVSDQRIRWIKRLMEELSRDGKNAAMNRNYKWIVISQKAGAVRKKNCRSIRAYRSYNPNGIRM